MQLLFTPIQLTKKFMAIKNLIGMRTHLFLCNGGSCKLKGAEESTEAIRNDIHAQGLQDEIHTTKTLCNGRCSDGPVVIAQPENIWFKEIFPLDANEFVNHFLIDGVPPAEKLLFVYGQSFINEVPKVVKTAAP